METFKQLTIFGLLVFTFFISSCDRKPASDTDDDQDTVVISNIDTVFKRPIDVSKIEIDTNLIKTQNALINEQIKALEKKQNEPFKMSALKELEVKASQVNDIFDFDSTNISTSKPITDCLVPSGIRDLKGGILLQAYDFKKGDEAKLKLMGFFNVEIENESKVTVVEFAQFGSSQCKGKNLPYGIGARMMLQIIKKKRKAKVETPQQITASVIFGMAEVKYTVRTFGITGPKIASLMKSGILSENTFNDFVSAMADMVVEAYKPNSEYIIFPQYMPLNQ